MEAHVVSALPLVADATFWCSRTEGAAGGEGTSESRRRRRRRTFRRDSGYLEPLPVPTPKNLVNRVRRVFPLFKWSGLEKLYTEGGVLCDL